MVTMIYRARNNRPGVLLLVVLSTLTLFLMLGATYLAVARRARMASKAFAENVTAASTAGAAGRQLVDEAFLAVVRGTTATTAPAALTDGDDLLGDKYGHDTAMVGNVTAVTPVVVGGSQAILELTVTGLNPSNECELNGCVITFMMPELCASTRVLQAYDDSGVTKIVVAAGPTVSGASVTMSKVSTTAGRNLVVINGREFADSGTNEAYDGFDGQNKLLSRIADETVFGVDFNNNGDLLDPVAVKSAPINASASLTVDNDADGEPDSAFLNLGLPPIVTANGDTVFPRAAVLVLDLDGRLNVNVHGSDANLEAYDDEAGTWPADGVVDFRILPRGSGVGPAEVSLDRSLIFSPPTGSAVQSEFIEDGAQVKGGRTTLLPYPNVTTNSRETPQIGSQFGRFGGTWDDGAVSGASDLTKTAIDKPGVKNENDTFSQICDYWRGGQLGGSAPYAVANYFSDSGRYASPYDWKGRLRVWVSPTTGEQIYYKPLWNGGLASNELVDDPYEVNLTPTGPRGLPADANAVDNLFSCAELEGLLRYSDSDSLKLGRRLVALCGEMAEDTRPLVTTESWDTPAVTGQAWAKVIGGPFGNYLSDGANSPFSVFSPETVQGLKFDINRPFHDPTISASAFAEPNDSDGVARRQDYAKQLFCLLVAVTRYQRYANDVANAVVPPFDLNSDDLDQNTTRQLAQFAINVVDFRDQDAVMTPFDYMSPEDRNGNGSPDTEDGNGNGGLDPGEDANGNGILDTEDLNGDGVLNYGFKPDNTTWAPNARVWGCERPELVITETHAWHDRRTDDEAIANKVVENPQSNADNDFDQLRRPIGAFFVELMAPQASQAKAYDGGVTSLDGPVDASEHARAEPIPKELVDEGAGAKDRFETGGTLDVAKRTPATAGMRCPVWRLVSVRGDVHEGTAFNDTTGNATMEVRDPSSDNQASVVDRVFYFAPPPTSLQNPVNRKDGKQGGVFWASQSPSQQPTRANCVVVGTDGPRFDFTQNPLHADNPATNGAVDPDPGYATATAPALAYVDQVHLRFDSPRTSDATDITPATLSEPIHTTSSSDDPYNVIATAISSSNSYSFADPSVDQKRYSDAYRLTTANNAPFDSFTTSPPGISSPFLTKEKISGQNRPLLMINGTHPNFAVVHLQRLADPTQPHDPATNPYLTVDSMPVDLTVVNTSDGSRSVVHDEPGQTPPGGPGELAWLQDQNHFRRQSIERGGKDDDDSGVTVEDIWSSRVRSDITDVEFEETDNTTWTSQEAYRSPPNDNSFPATHPRHKATARRSVLGLNPPLTPGGDYVLQNVPVGELGVHDSTLRTTVSDNAIPALFPPPPIRFPWLAFHNRPFVSSAELSLVPTTSARNLGVRHTTEDGDSPSPRFYHLPQFFDSPATGSAWEALVGEFPLFEFLHTPSPYAGMRRSLRTTGGERTALEAVGWDYFPYGQLSQFREPGRVNVNTMPDPRVWRAVQGNVVLRESPDTLIPDDADYIATCDQARNFPDADGTTAGFQPFLGIYEVLANAIDLDSHAEPWRDTNRNACFRTQTLTRLQNLVTVRSNVYAIWVTVGYFDGPSASATEITPVKRNRGFYIFDRSIPVAYERGKDHNVRDAILLRRIIQ